MKNLLLLIFCCNIFCLSAQVRFTPAHQEANIDHVLRHVSFMGGGAAFFDYDNDGDEDLYITSGNDLDHFYVNNGDGTFTNKSVDAGFADYKLYYSMGVIAGDIDNDGYKDLFVTTNKKEAELAKNLLFKNNGDGTFTEIWAQEEETDKVFSIGATFLDYDLDGLVDIYVINYVENVAFTYNNDGDINGFAHECFENLLYKNLGNGQFEEVGASLGLADKGCALAVASTDFDMDNDIDLYIANDFGEFIIPNQLFESRQGGDYFNNSGNSWNADIKMYGMGIAIGDIDNDLDLDYYVTNFGKNRLLINQGNEFADLTDACNIGDEWIIEDSLMTVGWGTSFLDVDNDADLDLYVANGYVPSPGFLDTRVFQNDKLFINNGGLNFEEADTTYGIENQYVSRGMTHADYDNDGDLDILSVVLNVPMSQPGWETVLYKNEGGNEKNWLQVTLEGVDTHRDAFGSKVLLHAENQSFIQELSGGSSHCSHLSTKMHFGLNDIETIDSLEVIWTGGRRTQTVYDIDINQVIHVVEDTTIVPLVVNVEQLPFQNNQVLLYPNPSNEIIHIELQNGLHLGAGKIEIYNSIGQLKRVENVQSGVTNVKLNIQSFSEGIYYFAIKTDEIIASKKVIISRKQ